MRNRLFSTWHPAAWAGAAALVFVVAAAVALVARSGKNETRPKAFAAVLWALSGHDQLYGYLPPPIHRDPLGRPLCSWRFPLTILFGKEPDYHSAPWYSSALYRVASQPCEYYCFSPTTADTRLYTNVFAVVGPGTAFDGTARSLSQLDADTILIVEVRNTGIHWMEPGDVDVRHLPQTIAADTSADSFHVGFADGEVWLLDAKVPVDELRKFLTLEGARQWDRQSCLGPYGRRVYPN